ncbi:predicted protein [Naegleria gruberi]|uniref:Predicted protein n=1 Tax=Naegleria gruberi TaxID=5762 RepID=D2V5Q7_NAEGR|nr:uncharacterized protein NAEGRDRAFT_46883 [Naegleria gruberi]EFC47693.1 predicted protein [Naegleria gruberi]|eukprot:XP_002680437.1 predicted protein [Naegleria gruberi strain NEG-M]
MQQLQSFNSVAAASDNSTFSCSVIVNNQANQSLSDRNCLNGGKCVLEKGICNCTSGFTGSNCSITIVAPIPQSTINETTKNETNSTSLDNTKDIISNTTNNSTNPDNNIVTPPTWKCVQGVNCIFGNCTSDGKFCNCSIEAFTVKNETLVDPLDMVYCNYKNCPNNCSMNGVCDYSTGQCICSEPYFSNDCSLKNCTVSCVKGQGDCDFNTGKCKCKDPYFGKDCSSIQCADPSCNSVGRCNHKKGLCECDADHFGDACQFWLCKNNCTQHGFCNTTTSLCSCVGAWTERDCGVNSNVVEMGKIKESSRIIGTLFVFLVPISLVIGSYYVTYSYFGGYFFLIVEIFQFIGITSLIGSNSPALYLKYSSFFEWSNFLFSTAESAVVQSAAVEIGDIVVRSVEEERLLLYKLIGISFIDNLPYTQPGRNTIQIMVEAVNLFNIVVLVLFNAFPFNSFASNLLTIITIFLHCCIIILAVVICIFEKKRNTETNSSGYRAGLLTEEELEIQGTHTIFESDSEDERVNNLDLRSDFHEIDLDNK